MTPRSSCPGGDPLFSRAQTSGSITNSTLYRKTARGWGTCRPSSAQASRAVVAQLQTTWVTFDKQTWVTSPARRSHVCLGLLQVPREPRDFLVVALKAV